jgi:hypothetical protein
MAPPPGLFSMMTGWPRLSDSFLPEDPRDDVVAAAGGEADDDVNWPRRIFRRVFLRGSRGGRHCGERDQPEILADQGASRRFHGVRLPLLL